MSKTLPQFFAPCMLLLVSSCVPVYSQCLVVTPTGSGNGSGTNWSNAINGSNLTSVVARGNTYYLAGGLYGFANGYQTFSAPDSGSQTITIRAATAADQGTAAGCGQTGWTAAMAASGSNQVVFRCSTCLSNTFNYQLRFLTDYWILDGNDPTRTLPADSSSAYNMAIDNSWHGGPSDGSGLGFHVMLGANGTSVHDITMNAIEYKGTGLDSMNVDPQPISSISCNGSNAATITLAGQRNHAFLFPGEWVTIGATSSHAKDTADTLSAGPEQVGSTTNGQISSCTESGTIATCTMAFYVPVISTDRSQSVVIASNNVSGYNGNWPVTGINAATKTISFDVGGTANGLGTGSGGNATWNGSVGVQIQTVTSSTDWTKPFTVSGNGYTCSGGTETTGVLAGPDVMGGGGIDMVNGVTNGVFNYSYGHDFLGLWDIGGDSNITIKGNACERIYSHTISPFHASCLAGDSGSGTTGLVFANNLIMDTEGTGDVGVLFRNGPPPVASNWQIYGNVFGLSPGNPYGRNSNGNGQVFCINTVTCSNWYVVNNTIVGDGTPHVTHWGFIQSGGATASSVVCENNFAYNATQYAGVFGTSLCATEDHNTYANLGLSAPLLNLADFALASQPDPFVSDASHNYTPVSDTLIPHLNDGVTTNASVPGNATDAAGTTRGVNGSWDRGAFQSANGGGTVAPPNAPQTVTITVR